MNEPAGVLRSIANTARLHPKDEKALHCIAVEIERLQAENKELQSLMGSPVRQATEAGEK